MRIELSFYAEPEEFPSLEAFTKYVRHWERTAAKNRRFKGVKVVKIIDQDQDTGLYRVVFDGEEDALNKLFLYYNELTKKDASTQTDADFEEVIVSEEELNEVDYGQNNTRYKHYKASNKKDKYWIYASDTDLSHVNYFVKIDWDSKKVYLAPTTILDRTARTDLKPFMTNDPAKIHAVALMASKTFPKFWFSIQNEPYRETTLSRFNNTARPNGLGITYDPKVKTWVGGIDEKLPPPEKISKKDDLFGDHQEVSQSKYEKMDPRKLPYEKSRLEKEIERTKDTLENAKDDKKERFRKELDRLEGELEEVNKLLG